MDKDINNELQSVLSELERLSNVVSKKESELGVVHKMYLEQIGTESFALHINENAYSISKDNLLYLIEQMQELGLFSTISQLQRAS